jgi:hypothetical protein
MKARNSNPEMPKGKISTALQGFRADNKDCRVRSGNGSRFWEEREKSKSASCKRNPRVWLRTEKCRKCTSSDKEGYFITKVKDQMRWIILCCNLTSPQCLNILYRCLENELTFKLVSFK